MIEKATIFIPDISGFTAFLSKTELDHSSHIISELLEVLVGSNCTGCTLAEIEGDALLFYHKGEALSGEALIRQCMDMFQAFHSQLKLIERDSICQCGACQTASNLTLKFIVHYGTIKELKIAHFTKASGLDMIIAHRLLKNGIASDEYILATQPYLDALSDGVSDPGLTWHADSETYPAIGKLDFQYTLLDEVRSGIADPPPREKLALRVKDDTVGVDVDAPMRDVYQLLVDLENRIHWIPGLRSGVGERPIDRLGSRHRCVLDEETYEIIPVASEIQDREMRYVERCTGLNSGLKYLTEYVAINRGEHRTHVEIRIAEEAGYPLSPDVMELIVEEWHEIAESFKVFCEDGAA